MARMLIRMTKRLLVFIHARKTYIIQCPVRLVSCQHACRVRAPSDWLLAATQGKPQVPQATGSCDHAGETPGAPGDRVWWPRRGNPRCPGRPGLVATQGKPQVPQATGSCGHAGETPGAPVVTQTRNMPCVTAFLIMQGHSASICALNGRFLCHYARDTSMCLCP